MNEDDRDEYQIISLPCSGKADLLYLLKAFETGADGLALVICAKHECRYLEGNLRAPRRAEETRVILEDAGLAGNRVTVLQMNEKGMGDIVEKVTAFREEIRRLSLYTACGRDAGTSVQVSLPASG